VTSEILHTAFGFFCHQAAERSPDVSGVAFLCYRCLGTFAGLAGSALVLLTGSSSRAYRFSRSDAWILGLSFAPLAIDGAATALGIWNSPGVVRTVSGLLLGSALGTLLCIARHTEPGFTPRKHHVKAILAGALVASAYLVHPVGALAVGVVMLVAGMHHLLRATSLIVAGLQGRAGHNWYRSVDLE
jgi:uncharacterized membrane protein